MNKALRKVQAVVGVRGEDSSSLYVGSDAVKAKQAYSEIAQKGEHSQFSQLAWFANGKLFKNCKLKVQQAVVNPPKQEVVEDASA